MIETVRRISRNVKHWRNGDMCLRWTAAGMLEAERQFRHIIGHGDLAKLAVTVEREVAAKRASHVSTEPVHKPSTTAAPQVAASPTRDSSLTGSPSPTSTTGGTSSADRHDRTEART